MTAHQPTSRTRVAPRVTATPTAAISRPRTSTSPQKTRSPASHVTTIPPRSSVSMHGPYSAMVRGRKGMATRVLVVDDSPTIRRVVGSVLERHGFEAIPAEDGQDALDQLLQSAEAEQGENGESNKIDIVLV